MALLRRGGLSVTEVCFAVGCQSLGTFSTRFTELVGVSPSVPGAERARGPGGTVLRGQAGEQTDQESRSACDTGTPNLVAMNLTINTTFLPHTDAEESLAFYRDVLGFEVRNDVGSGRMRWITVGSADQPQTSIVLHPPAVDPGITDDERRVVAEMIAKGTYAVLILATDDLDGTFERLQASGADIIRGADRPALRSARLRPARSGGQHASRQPGPLICRSRPLSQASDALARSHVRPRPDGVGRSPYRGELAPP